jgi:hypothetical protein
VGAVQLPQAEGDGGRSGSMLTKTLIVVMLLAIVASLFSGLFFLLRDGSGGTRTVRALTVRIILSLLLFAFLMIGLETGLLGGR